MLPPAPHPDDLLRALLTHVPRAAAQAQPPADTAVLPASRLRAASWLERAAAAEADRRGGVPPKVAGMLWWYSASSVLLGPPVASALVSGWALLPGDRAVAWLRPDGKLGGVAATRPVPADDLGAALVTDLEPTVQHLARACGATERALWAMVGDSLANRALDAARRLHREASGSRAAAAWVDSMRAAGAPLPTPRFDDVHPAGSLAAAATDPVPLGARRYPRRASCCLMYRAPDGGTCMSCPRNGPAERTRRRQAFQRRLAARA